MQRAERRHRGPRLERHRALHPLSGLRPEAAGLQHRKRPAGASTVTSGLVSRVVVDRCTFVGSTDGALDITGNVSDVTVSRNLFYGTPLTQLIKYDTRQRISLHHNVYTANGERNPQIKGDARDIDFVSNAIYNHDDLVGQLRQRSSLPTALACETAAPAPTRPGNVRANLRSNFYGGANSDLEIDTESGASAAASTSHPTTCAPGAVPASPAGAPNTVPAAYAVTATPVNCMASQMLPDGGLSQPHEHRPGRAQCRCSLALPGGCAASAFTLTVAKAGTGAGTVTSAPAGISCGSRLLRGLQPRHRRHPQPGRRRGLHLRRLERGLHRNRCLPGHHDGGPVRHRDLQPRSPTPSPWRRREPAPEPSLPPRPASTAAPTARRPTAPARSSRSARPPTAGSTFAGWSGACTGTGRLPGHHERRALRHRHLHPQLPSPSPSPRREPAPEP